MEAKIGTVVGNRRTSRAIVCPKCGETVQLHRDFRAMEVCPRCLQQFAYGWGADESLRVTAGFYDHAGEASVRAWIAECGGRYVPRYSLNTTAAEALAEAGC